MTRDFTFKAMPHVCLCGEDCLSKALESKKRLRSALEKIAKRNFNTGSMKILEPWQYAKQELEKMK